MEELINEFEAKIYRATPTTRHAHTKMAGIYHSWLSDLLDCKDFQDFKEMKNHIIKRLKQ